MEYKRARETAQKIGTPLGLTSEQVFLNFGCILGVDWLGDDVWIPNRGTVAHWLSGDVLTMAAADEDAPRVEFHPVTATTPWAISVTFKRTDSGDPLEKRLWVVSDWKFRLADGHELGVEGRFAVGREETEPDEDERFAHNLAKTMMGIA